MWSPGDEESRDTGSPNVKGRHGESIPNDTILRKERLELKLHTDADHSSA